MREGPRATWLRLPWVPDAATWTRTSRPLVLRRPSLGAGTAPRRSARWRVLMASLTVSAGVLTACSGSPSAAVTPSTRPSVGAVPSGITSPAQVKRPIDPYFLNADQVAATEFARVRAVASCMSAKGYASAGVKSDPTVAEAVTLAILDRTRDSDLYGFFDTPTNARSYGYQNPPGTSGTLGASWSPDVPQGVVDGCFADAAKSMGFDDVMELVLPKKLPDGGPVVPSGDPLYVNAVSAWSSCMAGRGYAYKDPQAAVGDIKWRADRAAGKASPAQVSTATADVECKISTNLIGVAVAVQNAYDQQYVDAHADALDSYRSRLQRAVQMAG